MNITKLFGGQVVWKIVSLFVAVTVAIPASVFVVVPLEADAAQPSATIDVNTINGQTPPFSSCLESPITITGSGSINPAGQIEHYNVEVTWGDEAIDEDPEANIPITLTNNSEPYSYTFTAGPHDYATSVSSITVKIYHVNPPGKDGQGDNAETVTVCITPPDPEPTTGTLTLAKVVTTDDGGTATAGDWTLSASGPTSISGASGDSSVTSATVDAGTYDLSEADGPSGYSASDWVCTGGTQVDGDTVTVAVDENVACTITNDDIAPSLTVNKIVQNDNETNAGIATSEDFTLYAGLAQVLHGIQNFFDAGSYTVSEDDYAGYNFVSFGGDCDSSGLVSLLLGDNKTCTITNNDNAAPEVTLNGAEEVVIIVGNGFSDPGATATDEEDGGLSIVVGGDVVDTDTIDTYEVTYSATDSNGVTTTVTRTVVVSEQPSQCADGIDNDGDGLIDLADSGCSSSEDNDENSQPVIDVELLSMTLTAGSGPFSLPDYSADDDEDGDITVDVVVGGDEVDTDTPDTYYVTFDVTDSNGASASTVTLEVTVEEAAPAPLCSNGIDDDDDGLTDADDPGCHTDGDVNNSGSYDGNLDSETNPSNECADGIDNDDDGLIDLADSGCSGLTDEYEEENPPESNFDESYNQIIDTEMESLSLTGGTTDDLSGVASVSGMEFFMGESGSEFSCDAQTLAELSSENEPVGIEFAGEDPLNVTWSYDWTPSEGVYCFSVSAVDNAGNVENTAYAGPLTYAPVAPPPPPPPPSPPPSGGGGGSSGSFQCSDGIDNDGDGLTDMTDPGCTGPTDNEEFNVVVLTPPPTGGTPPPPPPPAAPEGQVLGATTEELALSCDDIYLTDYVMWGRKHNASQVQKLQVFLNDYMSSNLPVTGYYGKMTRSAVMAFQLKYGDQILAPWVPFGLANAETPTGHVYKTTKWYINKLHCDAAAGEQPQLP